MKTCRRCLKGQHPSDVAYIDGVAYCHSTERTFNQHHVVIASNPPGTTFETCYMLRARVLADYWKRCE